MYNFIVTITNNSYINMYVTLHPNSLGQYLRKTDIESWLFNFIFHSHNKYCVEHGEFNNSNQLQNSSIETKKLVLCRLSLVQLTPLLMRINGLVTPWYINVAPKRGTLYGRFIALVQWTVQFLYTKSQPNGSVWVIVHPQNEGITYHHIDKP